MTIEGKWSPWLLLVHEYTAPLGVLSRSNWSSRREYIERLTGDAALGERIGRNVYNKMYR